MANIKQQSGVMLLEVLIALLIFAVGVLGLVGMQAMAIKLTAESKYRAEAASYAEELISQMWAGGVTPQYISDWQARIQGGGGLPGTTLTGNTPTAVFGANQITITIRWQSPDAQAASRFVTVARVNL